MVTIDAGTFALGRDAVTVANREGAVVATLPTSVRIAGHQYAVTPHLDTARTTLTLTPVGSVQPIDAWAKDLNHPSTGEVVGAVIGGVLGGLLGFLIGLPFLIFGAVLGELIGTIVGIGVGVTQGFDFGAILRP